MILRSSLQCEDTIKNSDSSPVVNEPQTLEAWLKVFGCMVHLSQEKVSAIADELKEHISERVRDLMISGKAESESMQIAISELGTAADLAKKFERANRSPKRRIIMNLSMLSLGMGVVVVGAMTITGSFTNGNQYPASFYNDKASEVEPPKELKEITVDLDRTTQLGEAFDVIAQTVNMPVVVSWQELQDYEVTAITDIELVVVDDYTVELALDSITAQLRLVADEIVWRVEDRIIEVGFQDDFDKRDVVLASYEIYGLLENLAVEHSLTYSEAADEVIDLLTEFVEPDNWELNGGLLAKVKIVGSKMFIEAPPRMHERIRWILAELNEGENVPVLGEMPTLNDAFDKKDN